MNRRRGGPIPSAVTVTVIGQWIIFQQQCVIPRLSQPMITTLLILKLFIRLLLHLML